MAFTTDNFSFKVKKNLNNSNPSALPATQSFVVELARYIYKNEENGFYVASVKVPTDYPNLNIDVSGHKVFGRTFTVVGTSSFVVENIKEKQEINVIGNFEINKGQPQFKAQIVKEIIPTKPKAIQVFLASGKIKGIGPVTAKKIVEKYGSDAINIFDTKPEELLTIDGISEKKLAPIMESWQLFRNVYEIMSTMQLYGVGDANGVKIYNHFKEKSLQMIKTDPYRLTEVAMIGFKTADKIAQSIGISHIDPKRIKYCILYTLEKLSEEGHTAYIKDELIGRVNEDLTIDPDLIVKELNLMITSGEVIVKMLKTKKATGQNSRSKKIEEAVYECVAHRKFHGLEARMAKEILRISSNYVGEDYSDERDIFIHKNPFKLDDSQIAAARTILSSKVSVLTGGPGTGKTHTIKSILHFYKSLNKKCLLCAPTGRAAKRMEESTGNTSSTMHRLLGFAEGKFKHDDLNPLVADVIIVDEGSMVDSFLNNGFLKAVPDKAVVIYVGDVDQLPSVGPGNILKDLIDCGKIAVARLNVIHRQAENSNIIKASHQVIRNQMPECINLPDQSGSDFEFRDMDSNDEIHNHVLDLVDQLIKSNTFQKDDIQVITPRKDGSCGVDDFNLSLKMLMNYDEEYLEHKEKKIKFSRGDRVMQYKNNYELDIFNGDVGKVVEFDYSDNTALVDFDNNRVALEGADLNHLKLSYAITIHKSQGSDYPCVIIPISKSHTFMWDSNLLYTAITRGKHKVFLVGDRKTLFYTVAQFRQNWRTTGLKEEIAKAYQMYSLEAQEEADMEAALDRNQGRKMVGN